MTDTPKTCSTCAHARGGFPFGKCALTGFYQATERTYPVKCDVNFSGWVKREPLLTRFKKWLYKE